MMDKNELMQKAIRLAVKNVESGRGGPFAALVVRDGEVIATGANAVTRSNDPTAHAEIMAIRKTCSKLGRFDLSGCELYSTSEPCPMCLGAIHWARLDRVYFAARTEDAARAGFSDRSIQDEMKRPYGKQSIAIERLSHREAGLPFEAWQKKADKILY